MPGRIVSALVIGIVGCAILVALGVWQVQRLNWKEAILAEADGKIFGPAQALPEIPDQSRDKYQPVAFSGTSLPEHLLVLTSHKRLGPGFRVIQAFETETRRILVDRGFVGQDDLPETWPELELSVKGNIHWPDEIGPFTPEPDIQVGLWFAREVEAMAAELGTEPLLVILAETTPIDPTVTPLPLDTSAIPNDHLQYAATWFGLAIVWLAMTLLWMRRIWRGHY
ncbi:MAG: SURF1 family protein [Mangrovicoccus sp.]